MDAAYRACNFSVSETRTTQMSYSSSCLLPSDRVGGREMTATSAPDFVVGYGCVRVIRHNWISNRRFAGLVCFGKEDAHWMLRSSESDSAPRSDRTVEPASSCLV